MAINNVGAVASIPTLQIPKQKTINDLNLINPLEDDLNGGPEQFRWGRMTAKEKLCMMMHEESFKNYGLLNGFVVVKVPESFTAKLDGQPFRYKKGTYITIDFNGRLRTLKKMELLGKIILSGFTNRSIKGSIKAILTPSKIAPINIKMIKRLKLNLNFFFIKSKPLI